MKKTVDTQKLENTDGEARRQAATPFGQAHPMGLEASGMGKFGDRLRIVSLSSVFGIAFGAIAQRTRLHYTPGR